MRRRRREAAVTSDFTGERTDAERPAGTRPATTVTAPATTVTATAPATTVTAPAETVTAPAETVTAPAATVTAPARTVTAPTATVTVTTSEGRGAAAAAGAAAGAAAANAGSEESAPETPAAVPQPAVTAPESEGVPDWAWGLIGGALGAALAALVFWDRAPAGVGPAASGLRRRKPRVRGASETGVTGLEPAASGLTVRCSNQSELRPQRARREDGRRWAVTDLNRRPPACKAGALPLS